MALDDFIVPNENPGALVHADAARETGGLQRVAEAPFAAPLGEMGVHDPGGEAEAEGGLGGALDFAVAGDHRRGAGHRARARAVDVHSGFDAGDDVGARPTSVEAREDAALVAAGHPDASRPFEEGLKVRAVGVGGRVLRPDDDVLRAVLAEEVGGAFAARLGLGTCEGEDNDEFSGAALGDEAVGEFGRGTTASGEEEAARGEEKGGESGHARLGYRDTMSVVVLLALFFVTSLGPPPFTFDASGLKAFDSSLSATAITEPAAQGALGGTLTSLAARYPAGGLAREVRRIVIVRDLAYDGVGMGALTYDTLGTTFLSVGDSAYSYRADQLAVSLHHEVMHTLLVRRAKLFPRAEWKACNARGFRYRHEAATTNGGLDAMNTGDFSEVPNAALNARGLLHPYAASCIEEDVASMAGELLALPLDAKGNARDAGVWAIIWRSPRLARKAAILRTFYRRVFPGIRFPALPARVQASL